MTTEAKTPKKRVPKPGMHNLHVSISDEVYSLLEKTADGRPLNVWLSKLIERNTTMFAPE